MCFVVLDSNLAGSRELTTLSSGRQTLVRSLTVTGLPALRLNWWPLCLFGHLEVRVFKLKVLYGHCNDPSLCFVASIIPGLYGSRQ